MKFNVAQLSLSGLYLTLSILPATSDMSIRIGYVSRNISNVFIFYATQEHLCCANSEVIKLTVEAFLIAHVTDDEVSINDM